MSNDTWGIFESMEDALYWIRQSEGKKDGYALIADATDTRYELSLIHISEPTRPY